MAKNTIESLTKQLEAIGMGSEHDNPIEWFYKIATIGQITIHIEDGSYPEYVSSKLRVDCMREVADRLYPKQKAIEAAIEAKLRDVTTISPDDVNI